MTKEEQWKNTMIKGITQNDMVAFFEDTLTILSPFCDV